MLVPPLLFIPFVQHIMELAHEQQTLLPVSLDIHLKAEKGTIVFTCMCRQLNLSVNRGWNGSDKGWTYCMATATDYL